jgi:hypothetical protein
MVTVCMYIQITDDAWSYTTFQKSSLSVSHTHTHTHTHIHSSITSWFAHSSSKENSIACPQLPTKTPSPVHNCLPKTPSPVHNCLPKLHRLSTIAYQNSIACPQLPTKTPSPVNNCLPKTHTTKKIHRHFTANL